MIHLSRIKPALTSTIFSFTPCSNLPTISAISARQHTSVAKKIAFAHNKRNKPTSLRSSCAVAAQQSVSKVASSSARLTVLTSSISSAVSVAISLSGSVGALHISVNLVTSANARVITSARRSHRSCPSVMVVPSAHSRWQSTHQMVTSSRWDAQCVETQKIIRKIFESLDIINSLGKMYV